MSLGRQHYVARGSALAFESRKVPLTLDGESALVVVGLAVDQQDGRFHFVGVVERRHSVVHFGYLPVAAFLALEAVRVRL